MGQIKGQTGNPHGRPKGVPNKLTIEVRGMIRDLLKQNLATISDDLEKLEPKQRIDVLISLLPYIVPKQDNKKGFEYGLIYKKEYEGARFLNDGDLLTYGHDYDEIEERD